MAFAAGGAAPLPGPPRLPTKSLMKPSFFSMSFRLTPILESCSSRDCQLGSTFSDVKPFSLEKPMCETCLNSEGDEIIDLSILAPPLLLRFISPPPLLLAPPPPDDFPPLTVGQAFSHEESSNILPLLKLTILLSIVDLLVEIACLPFICECEPDQEFLFDFLSTCGPRHTAELMNSHLPVGYERRCDPDCTTAARTARARTRLPRHPIAIADQRDEPNRSRRLNTP